MDPLQYVAKRHRKSFVKTPMAMGLCCETPIAVAAYKRTPLLAEAQNCNEVATTRPRL